MISLTPKARELIRHHEGLNQPSKVPPLDTSGITLGFGDDLGQHPKGDPLIEWGEVGIPPEQLRRLRGVVGLRGQAARDAAIGLRDIRISESQALAVFLHVLWPRYAALAEQAFPGLREMAVYAPDAACALVALVYNRGGKVDEADLDHPENFRREEMRFIRDAVLETNLPKIANNLVIMARLWNGKGVPGLLKRCIDEAILCDPHVVERLGELKALWAA